MDRADPEERLGLDPDQLEGFLKLLTAPAREMPPTDPKIAAFLEAIAVRQQFSEETATSAAHEAYRKYVLKRLDET